MGLTPISKKGGVVTNTVYGVGALIVGVIVVLVIVTTLFDAQVLGTAAITNLTVTNESYSGLAQGIWLNRTTYTLASANASTYNFIITQVYNQTDPSSVLPAANYTVGLNTGIIQNGTNAEYDNVTVSYAFYHTGTTPTENATATRMQANFTEGLNNISEKIPTILLVVAVVFLFGALALLISVARRMGLNGEMGSSL